MWQSWLVSLGSTVRSMFVPSESLWGMLWSGDILTSMLGKEKYQTFGSRFCIWNTYSIFAYSITNIHRWLVLGYLQTLLVKDREKSFQFNVQTCPVAHCQFFVVNSVETALKFDTHIVSGWSYNVICDSFYSSQNILLGFHWFMPF